jgi:hypothetical protein
MRTATKIATLVTAGAAITAGFVLPGTASAAPAAPASSPHSVSGTVIEGGAWFKSSTVRTVGATTNIQLSLTQIPSHGIQWRLINAKNGAVFTGTTHFTSVGTKTLATDVLKGTLFQNDFAQNDGCDFNCGNYNFNGSEIY